MSSVNTDYRIETRIFTRAFPQIIRSLPYPPSFPPEKNFAKRRKSAQLRYPRELKVTQRRVIVSFSLSLSKQGRGREFHSLSSGIFSAVGDFPFPSAPGCIAPTTIPGRGGFGERREIVDA